MKTREIGKYVLLIAHTLIAIGVIVELVKLFLSDKLTPTSLTFAATIGVALILSVIYGFRNDFILSNRIHQKDDEIGQLSQEYTDLVIKSEIQNKELENYMRLFPMLNKAFLEIRGCHRDTFDNEKKISGLNIKQNYESCFKDFCTTISTGFTNLKGTYCHVSVKYVLYVKGTKDDFLVRTLARDRNFSEVNRHEIDLEPHKHYVDLNSDYKQIFFKSEATLGRHYFNNNIMDDPTYENSSFFKYYKSNKYPANLRKEAKTLVWDMPYKSTICAGISDRLQVGTLVGYFCIDADEIGVFNEIRDCEILAGCADDLYDALQNYIENYVIPQK